MSKSLGKIHKLSGGPTGEWLKRHNLDPAGEMFEPPEEPEPTGPTSKPVKYSTTAAARRSKAPARKRPTVLTTTESLG